MNEMNDQLFMLDFVEIVFVSTDWPLKSLWFPYGVLLVERFQSGEGYFKKQMCHERQWRPQSNGAPQGTQNYFERKRVKISIIKRVGSQDVPYW